MKRKDLASRLETLFGYPIANNKQLLDHLQEYLEIKDDEEVEEIIAEFASENIHWQGEHQPGEAPFARALELEYTRLQIGEPPPPPEAQPVKVLARHLAGLFAFRFGFSFGNTGLKAEMGSWLADLNPREDELIAPVYYHSDRRLPRWYIFESPRQFSRCKALFREVQATFEVDEEDEEEPARHKRLAAKLVATFPQAVRLFSGWFATFGVRPRGLPRRFEDRGAQALFGCYDALLPIARILVSRSRGRRGSVLADAEEKRCLAATAGASNYPPALLIGMLARALSGDEKGARQAANKILRDRLGVALTRTWARKVLDHAPPFDS